MQNPSCGTVVTSTTQGYADVRRIFDLKLANGRFYHTDRRYFIGAVQVCRLRGREAGNRRLCIIELPAIKNFEYGILEK